MGSYFRDFYAPKATEQPTIGDTKFSVVNQDHMGWMNCDGRLLSTNDYALLFRVIGYSFGGSGDQFRLPDMRSRVPGAINQGAGLTNRSLGASVGEETHTLTIAEMPSHNHGTDASDTVVGNNLTGAAGSHFHTGTTDTAGTHSHDITTANAGASVENRVGQAIDNVNEGPASTQSAGAHTHTFTTNTVANHQHSIATQGGNQAYNIMQPTLFVGNMFIYSGKLHSGSSRWRYALDTNIL